jgi:hypothetical protein
MQSQRRTVVNYPPKMYFHKNCQRTVFIIKNQAKFMKIKLLFSFLFCVTFAFAQDNFFYETAFSEFQSMLIDKQPLNFKKAVFLVEQAYFESSLDTSLLSQEINRLV